jgi:hypothetical protein
MNDTRVRNQLLIEAIARKFSKGRGVAHHNIVLAHMYTVDRQTREWWKIRGSQLLDEVVSRSFSMA